MDIYRYFQSHQDNFWQWEEGDEVLAIPGGDTIALRPIIVEMITHLRNHSLPPFSCLLLGIIATNPSAEFNLAQVQEVVEKHHREESERNYKVRQVLGPAFAFLLHLSQVPEKYKIGKNRLLLFKAIFYQQHNTLSPRKAERLLKAFKARTYELKELLTPSEHRPSFLMPLSILARLATQFPSTTAILEKIAELPEIEEAVVLEEEQGNTEGDLIEQLIENSKTFHVGVLVKHLWAGLSIPAHPSLPSAQPLGGVSDLTNKGEFDRLLISEFANEETLFLSRLANNEALYLNREIPPQASSFERMILIDASIKAWGTPKVLAFAIAIAIATHPKTESICQVYVIGEHCYPVAIEQLAQVIEGLKLVDACLDASEGMHEFFQGYRPAKSAEVVLISAKAIVQQVDFQQVLQQYHQQIDFQIHTDAQGTVEVYKQAGQSKKQLQQLQLPIEELWKKPPIRQKSKPVQEELRFVNYPLLFPSKSYPEGLHVTDGGQVYQIVKSGRHLFAHDENTGNLLQKGWRLIYENLPTAGLYAIGNITEKGTVVMMLNHHQKKVVSLDLRTGKQLSYDLSDVKLTHVRFFIFHENAFHYQNGSVYLRFTIAENIRCEVEAVPPKMISEAAQASFEKRKLITGNTWYAYSILSKVKDVYINDRQNLVLNGHELRCTEESIQFNRSDSDQVVIRASSTKRNEFVFPNGSRIRIHRMGMIIAEPPPTDNYKLVLIKVGDKTELIKKLRLKTELGPFLIKQMVVHTPNIIYTGLTENEARNLMNELAVEGTEMKVESMQENPIYIPSVVGHSLGVSAADRFAGDTHFRPSNSTLKTMKTTSFWERYTIPFIKQITDATKA